MATKKISKPKKAEWKGFHNVSLTAEDERAFLEWHNANIAWDAAISKLSDAGYKISFDYDPYNEGFRASLYATAAKMEWAGYTLTAWASDATTAFSLLLYKHFVMCKETWEIAKEVRSKGTSNFG